MVKDNRYYNKVGRKEYIIRKVQELRVRRKAKLIELKGGKCSFCGYDKCPDALELHHKDPEEKDFQLNNRTMGRKWEVIFKEVEKCILLCANCHREVHYQKRRGMGNQPGC